jgi:hypothetical protein
MMMNSMEQPLQHQTTSADTPMSTTPSHSERQSNEVEVETVDSDDDEERVEAPPRDAIEENIAMIISLARKLKAMATAAIVQEVRHFRRDWHEHLQLTDGTCDNNDDLPNDDDSMLFEGTIPNETTKNKRKGSKSIMFKFIKPFLKLGKLRRRKKVSNEQTEDISDYNNVPPLPPPIV